MNQWDQEWPLEVKRRMARERELRDAEEAEWEALWDASVGDAVGERRRHTEGKQITREQIKDQRVF